MTAAGALVIGEALVDIVTRDGVELARHPGGSCANVAVALARLGRPTALATRLGADAGGELVRRHLADSGVRLLIDERGTTSTAIARIDDSGAARYEFDLDWSLDPAVVATAPAVLHVGSLGGVLEPGAAVVREIVGRLRATAHVSYDVNARAALTPDLPAARRAVEDLVGLAHLVKASDEDVELFYPGVPLDEVAAAWLARGPAAVAFTLGGAGASCFTAEGRVDVPARSVAVVDTIGAGDTFSAGLVDALWPVLTTPPVDGALARLPLDGWRAALEHAALAASITVTRSGANPPWRAELAEAAGVPQP